MPPDPLALLRSRSYVILLVLAAIIGVPISAAAYFFLALISKLNGWIFTDLPHGLGFHSEPLWWPIPPLVLAGILVALTLRFLPGTGGHSPADGFKTGGGPPAPIELPGIVLAALAAAHPWWVICRIGRHRQHGHQPGRIPCRRSRAQQSRRRAKRSRPDQGDADHASARPRDRP